MTGALEKAKPSAGKKKINPDDLYALLELTREATEADIRAAFKRLAKSHHPDVNGGDDAHFKNIKRAHDTLLDEKTRELYDRYGFVNGGADIGHIMAAFDALSVVVMQQIPKINVANMATGDLVAEMRKIIKAMADDVKKQIKEMTEHGNKVEEIRAVLKKRLKRKEATTPDPFMKACEKALDSIQQQKKFLETDLQVKKIMLKILDEYTYDYDPAQAMSLNDYAAQALQSMGGSGGGQGPGQGNGYFQFKWGL